MLSDEYSPYEEFFKNNKELIFNYNKIEITQKHL